MVIAVVLHSLLFLFYTEIRPPLSCRVYNSIVTKYYSFFYYPILSTAIPFVVTIGFSLLAYSNVRRIVRRQMPIFRRRLDRLMTALVLSRVLCIAVCGLPYIIITLIDLNIHNSGPDDLSFAIRSLVGAIFYTLLYTNFSVRRKTTFFSPRCVTLSDQFLHFLMGFDSISSTSETFSLQTTLSNRSHSLLCVLPRRSGF